MLIRSILFLGVSCGLIACGGSQAEYDACLDAIDVTWETCADSCDSTYPDEDDDAAWEACMNGCDQDAEFATDDCDSI